MESTNNYGMLRYAYIVEGATDEDKLKKLGCLFVIKTGGKYIRPDIMDFIYEVSKVRPLVLLTDPDGPGRDIADRIEKRVGSCIRAEVNKKDAIKKGKVGIAEMHMDDLKEVLRPYVHHDLFTDENLSLGEDDFYDLGLEGPGSKAKRMKLVERYHIPYTSSKNVEEALLMLCVSREQILEIIKDDRE